MKYECIMKYFLDGCVSTEQNLLLEIAEQIPKLKSRTGGGGGGNNGGGSDNKKKGKKKKKW